MELLWQLASHRHLHVQDEMGPCPGGTSACEPNCEAIFSERLLIVNILISIVISALISLCNTNTPHPRVHIHAKQLYTKLELFIGRIYGNRALHCGDFQFHDMSYEKCAIAPDKTHSIENKLRKTTAD